MSKEAVRQEVSLRYSHLVSNVERTMGVSPVIDTSMISTILQYPERFSFRSDFMITPSTTSTVSETVPIDQMPPCSLWSSRKKKMSHVFLMRKQSSSLHQSLSAEDVYKYVLKFMKYRYCNTDHDGLDIQHYCDRNV